MKYVLSVVVLAALGLGGWYAWSRNSVAKPAAESSPRAATAIVEARDISFAVTAAGDIGPADQVSVRPEINGRIAELPVDIGDQVKQGALLCRLDDRDLQIERDQRLTEISGAKLQIEASKLHSEKAERDFERAKGLFEESLISKEQFDNQRTELDLTRNQILIAQNTLERANKNLSLVEDRITKTRLLAPFDCTVLTRPVSLGQTVSGAAGFNAGTEIMSIANLGDLVVNAHINQADVVRLVPNQEVAIQVESLATVRMRGVIERIAPQATIRNGIKGFAARIRFQELDPRVRPGMTAMLTIPIAAAEDVLAVPLAAVFTEENERFVLIKTETSFERRLVQIGVADYQFAEVQQGLQAGEEVFLEPPKEALANQQGKNEKATAKNGNGREKATTASPKAGTGLPAASEPRAVIIPPSNGSARPVSNTASR